jgi:hypothetical protein
MLFIVVNLIFPLPGNPNPASRLATLSALSEYRSFRIDSYVIPPQSWTNDWARTPDGACYSNKAPGPVWLGFPVFAIVDHWRMRGLPNAEGRNMRRRSELPLYNLILCALIQILPFALLSFVILRWLPHEGASVAAQHWTALALFFGNTASCLMNTYFGHALAGFWLLAVAIFLDRARWKAVGFCLGWAVLCDYSALIWIPVIFGMVLFRQGERARCLRDIAIGLVIPVILWIWYHQACFGRPWRLALQFQSPEFRDLKSQPHALWGILAAYPNPYRIGQLLFGWSRGILVTQPWVLVLLVALVGLWKRRPDVPWRPSYSFSLLGFGMLLGLNSAFGGWHGGQTIGPRYLSIVFPCLALTGGLLYDQLARPMRQALWIGLMPALILYALIFSTTLYVPPEFSLWPALLAYLMKIHPYGWFRFAAILGAFTGGLLGFVWNHEKT